MSHIIATSLSLAFLTIMSYAKLRLLVTDTPNYKGTPSRKTTRDEDCCTPHFNTTGDNTVDNKWDWAEENTLADVKASCDLPHEYCR
ncbi:hypothetical protein EDD17DRAFT_1609739 [Pisolithus thermaeus]|nr:hypothetical protein EDD17DRAFT_1609739 [Pisolithus thermaeus]